MSTHKPLNKFELESVNNNTFTIEWIQVWSLGCGFCVISAKMLANNLLYKFKSKLSVCNVCMYVCTVCLSVCLSVCMVVTYALGGTCNASVFGLVSTGMHWMVDNILFEAKTLKPEKNVSNLKIKKRRRILDKTCFQTYHETRKEAQWA